MTSKERYHNDKDYREKVIEKAVRWRKNNPYAYLKKKLRAMQLKELEEFIDKHKTIIGYANDERERRVSY